MNILVTGANGQLGTELRDVAAGSRDNFIFSDIISLPGVETLCLDITDIEAVRIVCELREVDVIVNCAAYTNVDKAEDEAAMAMLLNSAAAGNLARRGGEEGYVDPHFHGLCLPRGRSFALQGGLGDGSAGGLRLDKTFGEKMRSPGATRSYSEPPGSTLLTARIS